MNKGYVCALVIVGFVVSDDDIIGELRSPGNPESRAAGQLTNAAQKRLMILNTDNKLCLAPALNHQVTSTRPKVSDKLLDR